MDYLAFKHTQGCVIENKNYSSFLKARQSKADTMSAIYDERIIPSLESNVGFVIFKKSGRLFILRARIQQIERDRVEISGKDQIILLCLDLNSATHFGVLDFWELVQHLGGDFPAITLDRFIPEIPAMMEIKSTHADQINHNPSPVPAPAQKLFIYQNAFQASQVEWHRRQKRRN